MIPEADFSPSFELVSPGRVDEDELCEDSEKSGIGTVYLGRTKSYPLGL